MRLPTPSELTGMPVKLLFHWVSTTFYHSALFHSPLYFHAWMSNVLTENMWP